MLRSHEILGTDLPIYKEMPNKHFTSEEIRHLGHRMSDFKRVGYVSYVKFNQTFFKPIYELVEGR